LLSDAVRRAAAEGALIVAVVGNDGCACLHVPGALPTVLAVGAMDRTGRPIPSSNWGEAYRTNGGCSALYNLCNGGCPSFGGSGGVLIG
jgi:hypothetical protein